MNGTTRRAIEIQAQSCFFFFFFFFSLNPCPFTPRLLSHVFPEIVERNSARARPILTVTQHTNRYVFRIGIRRELFNLTHPPFFPLSQSPLIQSAFAISRVISKSHRTIEDSPRTRDRSACSAQFLRNSVSFTDEQPHVLNLVPRLGG